MYSTTKNAIGTPRVRIDVTRIDIGQKLIDITDVEYCENFG